MGDGLASYWTTRFLAPFFARHPNIELKLFTVAEAVGDKQELFDLHVHYYEPAEAEYATVRLGTMHFLPFASREYLRLYGVPRGIDDLPRHRLLDLAIYLADMGSWSSWSREDARKYTMLFTNMSGCLAESVRFGAGIALLPTFAPIVDDTFTPIDIGLRFQTPIYASYQRDSTKKWAVRTTIDFLRAYVFDRKSMPWFRDTYHAPAADWSKRFSTIVVEAALPEDPREQPLRRRLSVVS